MPSKKTTRETDPAVELADFLAGELDTGQTATDIVGGGRLYLRASRTLLLDPVLQLLQGTGIVLHLSEEDVLQMDAAGELSMLESLRHHGYCIALPLAAISAAPRLILHAGMVEIDGSAATGAIGAQLAALSAAAASKAHHTVLAAGVTDWQQFDACAASNIDVLAGSLMRGSRPPGQPRGLNASQAIILQAMDLLLKNADVRQLEAVLKRDATLSYKLFRYINSAGFGLGTEVQSLRHAVNLLGYATLQRWLSLLLMTASAGGYASAVMQTVVTRARLAELLGSQLLSKKEAEELFVAGMFSSLDQLLGVPLSEVLKHVSLSEAVTQALLHRDGIYGPFLALAGACEQGGGEGIGLAEGLLIESQVVNRLHLESMGWGALLESFKA